MKVKFLGQGLDTDVKNTAGYHIVKALENNDFNLLKAFVAFARQSGINEIIDDLNTFNLTNEVELFVGIDLNGTSKEALELLLNNNIKTYIIYSPNTITYHPKIYFFKGEKKSRIIVGSSNLTQGGLFNNIESSLCIDLKNKDKKDKKVIEKFNYTYAPLIKKEHSSCQELTSSLLSTLIDAKLVLPEKKIAKNIAKQKKELEESSSKNDSLSEIKELFKGIKITKKVNNIKVGIEKEQVVVIDDEIKYTSNSMWHETKALTGGSGNILDISMSGHKDGNSKKGAGTFFNIDDKNKIHNITIEYSGKKYEENTLKYAPDNGSWRLQLKGKTSSGDKFTDHTRDGQLKYKILLFEKKSNLNYKLTVLEEKEIDNLKSISDWAYGGKSGKNKIFGFIK